MIDSLGLAGFFLLHRDLLELAREVAVEVRGPATARALLPPGRGRGSSVSSIVCYLTGLSHIDPIANDLFLNRFLERGAQLAAGHRSGLPARRAREADSARARSLRQGALGAGGGVPDVPLARGDPGAGQGLGVAARRVRARRSRRRAVGGQERGAGRRGRDGDRAVERARPVHRSRCPRVGVRDEHERVAGDGPRQAAGQGRGARDRSDRPRSTTGCRDGGRGWRGCATRRTGCRAISPSTRAG